MRHREALLSMMVVMLLFTSVAAASPGARRPLRRRPVPAEAAAPVHSPQMPPSYQPYWSFVPELYPQWYGGFHGRMLQNYGYPPGDLGLRGTAW
jgi:hypothetical protein